MNSIIKYSLLSIFLIFSTLSTAQISINTDNSDPDPSAMLDIKSTNKGILIPRLTTTQRTALSNLATGLLVYDSTTNSFWYYSGMAWTELRSGLITALQDAGNNTKIQVEESSSENKVRIDLDGSERVVIEKNANGSTLIQTPNNNRNTFLGEGAGQMNAPTINDGHRNSFFGYRAGYSNSTGRGNNFIGHEAGYSSTTGGGNLFVGEEAGWNSINVYENVFLGSHAGRTNTSGNNNIYIGVAAGFSNQSGGGNIFIGHEAGGNETTSNKLYIENSFSSTPLIYGEFDNDLVKIHGTLGIGNTYTFPTNAGTAGQVLQTDGAGNTAWATPAASTDDQKADVFNLNGTTLELSLENDGEATKTVDLSSINSTKSLIADANNTTKIQVEENPDENKVRIDLAGSERMIIEQSPSGGTLINLPNNNSNTFLGQDAGRVTTQTSGGNHGMENNFFGYQAGYSNTDGHNNVFTGFKTGYNNQNGYFNHFAGNESGFSNTEGHSNVFLGYKSGYSNTHGHQNTFVGFRSGHDNDHGDYNVFIGFGAGNSNKAGERNTYNGHRAGYSNINGVNNVFLGHHAGYNELGSNRLYIENSDSSTPLIYGEFDNDLVKIHGTLGIGNTYTFPTNAGTTGQVLLTDGAGNTAWATPSVSTPSLIADAGNNTKIQVEETAGENKVRIDLDGSERIVIEKNASGSTMLNLPNSNGNIFLGDQAGLNETGANKLYIENSASSNPLIYGEFDNNKVTVNGELTATGITYPNAGIHFPNAYPPDPAYIGTSGNFLSFGHSGTSEDFLGYQNNVFYFRDSPGGADTANPDVYANDFKNYSSRRWKHNIEDLNNALSIIQKLRGVTYTWNEDHGGRDDFGFIAEEINEVLPEIAPKGKDGEVDGVSYGKLTPYLVEAIKEQQAQIEELKNLSQNLMEENQTLKNHNKAMQSDIQQLKAAVFGSSAAKKLGE